MYRWHLGHDFLVHPPVKIAKSGVKRSLDARRFWKHHPDTNSMTAPVTTMLAKPTGINTFHPKSIT